MPGSLKDIKELEADLETRPLRGITKQDILDLIRSQAKVAGTLNINNGNTPMTLVSGFNRIDAWETSRDTQGVQDGLAHATDPGGYFKIKNAGSGDYTATASLRLTTDTPGSYEIRVAQVKTDDSYGLTLYRDKAMIDTDGHLAIAAGIIKNVLKNEKLQLEIKGPNGAVVIPTYAQFGVWR